jgi:hypothetical protein
MDELTRAALIIMRIAMRIVLVEATGLTNADADAGQGSTAKIFASLSTWVWVGTKIHPFRSTTQT